MLLRITPPWKWGSGKITRETVLEDEVGSSLRKGLGTEMNKYCISVDTGWLVFIKFEFCYLIFSLCISCTDF